MSWTLEELFEAVNTELDDEDSEFCEEDFEELVHPWRWELYGGQKKINSAGGFTFESEEEYGGEGQGDDYWFVSKVTKDGVSRYIKWEGWYSSYEGSEVALDDCRFVEPREVMKIEWFDIDPE